MLLENLPLFVLCCQAVRPCCYRVLHTNHVNLRLGPPLCIYPLKCEKRQLAAHLSGIIRISLSKNPYLPNTAVSVGHEVSYI